MEIEGGYNPGGIGETPIGEQESEEVIDKKWFSRFESIFSQLEVVEQFDGDKELREAQKLAFFSGEIKNPTLDYPNIDIKNLSKQEEQLLELKNDIIREETENNPVLAQTYRWRINERIAEIRMLKAAAQGDMRRFSRYSEFVYGKPSEEIFEYTIDGIRKNIEIAQKSGNEDLIKVADELDRLLPDIPFESPIKKPEHSTIDQAHEYIQARYDEMKLHMPETGIADSKDIAEAFEESLRFLEAEGWGIKVISSSRTGINVNQSESQVVIPETRRVSIEKLKKLIMHEIRTHVERRERGERSKLSLLGLGLDRYIPAEEGIATFSEQALEGSVKDFSGLEYHLAAALAKGVDGQPRDFRQVYEILYRYFLLQNLAKYEEKNEAIEKSEQSAWVKTVRIFRGTDCKTPGACFTKDIAYREGNIAIWDLVERDSDSLLKFSIGKYDPTNKRHIWILSQLGILDTDLDELKS